MPMAGRRAPGRRRMLPLLNLFVQHAEYRWVLAVAISHHVADPVNPRDVIVAIVGGILLTLVLSRPRLRWLEQLTASASSYRLWAERALTALSFAMGGYAWASLFMVLHKQLGPEASAMLKGASGFIVLYAGLIHFEPFVAEWRSKGASSAVALYLCIAIVAALLGVELAMFTLEPSLSVWNLEIAAMAGTAACAGIVLYKWT
jgi:hypothetical protein